MANQQQPTHAVQSRALPLLKGRYLEGVRSPIVNIWKYPDGRHRIQFANGQTMMARPGLVKSYVDKQLQAAEKNQEMLGIKKRGGDSRLIPPSNQRSHLRFPQVNRSVSEFRQQMINGNLWKT